MNPAIDLYARHVRILDPVSRKFTATACGGQSAAMDLTEGDALDAPALVTCVACRAALNPQSVEPQHNVTSFTAAMLTTTTKGATDMPKTAVTKITRRTAIAASAKRAAQRTGEAVATETKEPAVERIACEKCGSEDHDATHHAEDKAPAPEPEQAPPVVAKRTRAPKKEPKADEKRPGPTTRAKAAQLAGKWDEAIAAWQEAHDAADADTAKASYMQAISRCVARRDGLGRPRTSATVEERQAELALAREAFVKAWRARERSPEHPDAAGLEDAVCAAEYRLTTARHALDAHLKREKQSMLPREVKA